MKLIEKIEKALKAMDHDELAILYEHIRLMEKMKSRRPSFKDVPTLEQIHKMTASSKDSWSDSAAIDREELGR